MDDVVKVLILVLSARREPWGALMQCSIETWDSEDHPQTQTIYYCGKGGTTTDKVFYSPQLSERLEDISSRTIEAFEEALDLPDWEYLARPNSSCYVHKDNLVKFCHKLPKHQVICGILSDGISPFLWGGCQYIFSRDVIWKLVENKDKWNHNLMDDQSITALAREVGIPIESNGRCASINLMDDGSYLCFVYGYGENFTFKTFDEFAAKIGPHFFFRCKQDMRRNEDMNIMRQLKLHLK